MTKHSSSFQRNFLIITLLCLTLINFCHPRNFFDNIDLSAQALSPTLTGFKITGNAGGDYQSRYVNTAGDINRDGYDDFIIGAYKRNGNQGAVYVIYGGKESSFLDLDLSTTMLDPHTTGFMITGNAGGDYFGWSVSTAGDIDRDGYVDIIVGAQGKNGNAGAAYVIYGGPKSTMSHIDLSLTTLNPTSTGFMITGYSGYDRFGASVSTAGDINNDGYDDIIVGAWAKGTIYVIYGRAKSAMSNIFLSSTTLNPLTTGFMITGGGSWFGWQVSTAGDINNDAYNDIIVVARYTLTGSSQGSVYVIYGGPKSTASHVDLSSTALDPTSTGFKVTGTGASNYFGWSVSSAGDIDNDGYDDIIIGDWGNNGLAYVIYGGDKSTRSNIYLSTQTLDPLTTGFMMKVNNGNFYFGASVSTAGDINKDGYDDIIVGARYQNYGPGAAFVIYGGDKSTRSNIDLSTTTLDPTSTGFKISGSTSNDQLGHVVSPAGDINKDGYDDIIIAAYDKDTSKGAVYVIYASCSLNCKQCSSESICTECKASHRLYQGKCFATCPDTTFVSSTTTCGDCSTNHCSSTSVCTECQSSYLMYQSKCFASCPDASFAILPNTCTDCPTNCKKCSSTSVCTECKTPYRLYQGKCFASCPDAALATSTTICEDCPAGCKKCSSTSVCTECQSSYRLYKSQCFASCPDTTFANTATTCQDCSTNCNHCSSSSICTECQSSYLIYQSKCFASCPDATFAILSTTCQDCSANCNKCSSASVCTECKTSYRLYQDKCFATCPDATFANTATTCQNCSTNCNHCSSTSLCTECKISYLMYQSKCFASCPEATFATPPTTCQDCSANCNKCSSASVCTECKISYRLYQDKCFATCPDATFPNTATTCGDCSADCKKCSSPSVCTECKSSYLIYQSKCFASCPVRTLAMSTTKCQDCPANCNKCSSTSVCTECKSSYLLYQSQCFASCPDATFLNTATTCEDCPNNCNRCTSNSVCTECKDSYLLYKSQCFASCPDSTLATSPTTCEDCPNNCNNCTSTSECIECISPFVLYKSGCLPSCPNAMFNNTNECKDCPSSCSSCTSQDSCQVCSPGFTLSDSLCTSSSYQKVQERATLAISSTARGISSVICVGSVVAPLTSLVSKTVQNTRYLNLSVTSDLEEIYQTWSTDLIPWEVPNAFANEDNFEASPSLFTRYDIDSPFLVNFWPTLVNIGIGLTTFTSCILFKRFLEHKKYEGWAYSLLLKFIAGSFNFALIQIYSCLDDILFYLVLYSKTNPFNSFFSWASMICAISFLAVGCCLVYFNFWIVKKYQSIKKQGAKDIEAFNERNKYWELFYSDFSDRNLWSQSFFAFLIIRSALSSLIITVLYAYPLLQTSFLMTLDGVILLFLYSKTPFNTLRGELAQYFYEIITLLVHMCTFILSLQDHFQGSSGNVRLIFSTAIIYLNTGLMGGSLGFMFIEIYKTISEKKREIKRKQAHNKCKEETQSLQTSETYAKKSQDFGKTKLNGNATTYNLNVETSQVLESNFNAETSRELYVDASSRINQIDQSATTIFIRRKMRRLNPRQQENL